MPHHVVDRARRLPGPGWTVVGWLDTRSRHADRVMAKDSHKRIDETMLYVHFAEAHLRPLPEPILSAQRGHDDPR
jgi:hypothetical protein